jgi:hypothetical protein
VLRFEAVVHNTSELGCGRAIDKFPTIVAKLAGMLHRFCTMLDCVDIAFVPDGVLDELPLPSQIGATRVGGIDLNKPRVRTALHAVLALSAAPGGFTVADLAAKVNANTGEHAYTLRQAAYDLHAPRGALLYPQHSWEELEGRFLGPMAYLDAKARGDSSLPAKQRSCSGV